MLSERLASFIPENAYKFKRFLAYQIFTSTLILPKVPTQLTLQMKLQNLKWT